MAPAFDAPEMVVPGAPMMRSFPMVAIDVPNRAFVWLLPVNAL